MSLKIFDQDLDERTLNALLEQPILGLDTETNGLDPRQNELKTIQIATANHRVYVVRYPNKYSYYLNSLLLNPSIKKVFHHWMFDARFLFMYTKVLPANPGCTKILSKILSPQTSSSLGPTIRTFLNVEMPDVRVDYQKWDVKEFSEEQKEYLGNDVIYLPELYNTMKPILLKSRQYEENPNLITASRNHYNIYQRALSAATNTVILECYGYDDLLKYEQDRPDIAIEKRKLFLGY